MALPWAATSGAHAVADPIGSGLGGRTSTFTLPHSGRDRIRFALRNPPLVLLPVFSAASCHRRDLSAVANAQAAGDDGPPGRPALPSR